MGQATTFIGMNSYQRSACSEADIVLSSQCDQPEIEHVQSSSIGRKFNRHDADAAQYIIVPFRIRQIPSERFQISKATC
jgi:hypothetical protein